MSERRGGEHRLSADREREGRGARVLFVVRSIDRSIKDQPGTGAETGPSSKPSSFASARGATFCVVGSEPGAAAVAGSSSRRSHSSSSFPAISCGASRSADVPGSTDMLCLCVSGEGTGTGLIRRFGDEFLSKVLGCPAHFELVHEHDGRVWVAVIIKGHTDRQTDGRVSRARAGREREGEAIIVTRV